MKNIYLNDTKISAMYQLNTSKIITNLIIKQELYNIQIITIK